MIYKASFKIIATFAIVFAINLITSWYQINHVIKTNKNIELSTPSSLSVNGSKDPFPTLNHNGDANSASYSISKMRQTMITTIVISLISCGFFGLYLLYVLIIPLNKITDFITQTSINIIKNISINQNLNKTVPFKSRKDEIGELGRSFENIIHDIFQFQEIIRSEKEKLRLAEDQTKNQKILLDKIIHNLPLALYAKNAKDDYRWIMWNKKSEKLFDIPSRSIIDKTDYDLFSKDKADFYRHEDINIMNNGQVVDIAEDKMITKRGTWIAHSIKVPIYDENNDPEILLVILEDVTEKKEMEENLRHSKKLAEQANHAKSEFLMNMSHELRTPMHSIIGFAKYGERKAESLSWEEQQENYTDIKESGEELLLLLNNLLDLSKLESGKTEFHFESHNIFECLCGVIRELTPLLSEKSIRIETDGVPDDIFIDLDQMKISQVIRNLLANSIKFSNANSLISVNLEEGGDSISMQVVDRGQGIPDGELEKIFDKFIQSSKTKTGAGGTGLGLPICKDIIKGHCGKIWAENNQYGGSTFTFSIPKQQKEKCA